MKSSTFEPALRKVFLMGNKKKLYYTVSDCFVVVVVVVIYYFFLLPMLMPLKFVSPKAVSERRSYE